MTQKKVVIHIEDEVYARVVGLEPPDQESLYNDMGIFVDGHRFMPAFQLGRWDGRIRFFEKNGKIAYNLLEDILPKIFNWGYEIEVDDYRSSNVSIDTTVDEEFFGATSKFKLRPYQIEAVQAALSAGSGMIAACTGAGKTAICAAMSGHIASQGLKIVVIVPSADLLNQTYETFQECFATGKFENLSVGLYSGAHKDLAHPIVIATWQTLQYKPELMQDFQAVIIDECHQAKADVLSELVMRYGKNIAYRFGVTGTIPKPKTDQLKLKSAFGSVLIEIPAALLIQLGYLSTVTIEPISTVDNDPDLPDYPAEKKYLTTHETRNRAIAELIMAKRDIYGNTLVMVNKVEQGKQLEEMIPGSVFLSGVSSNEMRQFYYDKFANEDGLIVIATEGIASTGISIDRIFLLFLVDASKSFIRAIQMIGRALRKKGDKHEAHVVDCYSSLKFGKKHAKERAKYYKEAGYPTLEKTRYRY